MEGVFYDGRGGEGFYKRWTEDKELIIRFAKQQDIIEDIAVYQML